MNRAGVHAGLGGAVAWPIAALARQGDLLRSLSIDTLSLKTLLPRWAMLLPQHNRVLAVVKLEATRQHRSRASVEPHARQINWQSLESLFQSRGLKPRAASEARPLPRRVQVLHAKVRQGSPFFAPRVEEGYICLPWIRKDTRCCS
jgi:hypothetical protein